MREPAVCHFGTQVLSASWLRFGSFSTDRQTVPSHCIHDGALFASWGKVRLAHISYAVAQVC